MAETSSRAFSLLDKRIQRWIWAHSWTEMRDIQELAIPSILAADRDVILASGTATGKTEAAFLPIISRLLAQPASGVRVLYISPLKALINDQSERMVDLCGELEIPVCRWHGDAPRSAKQKWLRDPAGIVLITPESLESLFVHHGPKLPAFFSGLTYVVVDELHAFIGEERGKQVQSLLQRIENVIGRMVPRVALSATLGDMTIAAEFLRPSAPKSVMLCHSEVSGQAIKLQIRGYVGCRQKEDRTVQESTMTGVTENAEEIEHEITTRRSIALHMFDVLRGKHNLVFANSRADVEQLADMLRGMSESRNVPNEFFPHHGSLSKLIREDVEERLKDAEKPTSVICTSTLELGIDVGSMESVAQLGSPPTVASLRQRIGRTGRRGVPGTVWIYAEEEEWHEGMRLNAALRARTVQAIAMVRLLIERWCEAPAKDRMHLSTFIQQLLSFIAQCGGVTARSAWRHLCAEGAFQSIDEATFTEVLECLLEKGLTERAPDGTILLGPQGERIAEHHGFYAAFTTPEEYQVEEGGRPLGRLPISFPLSVGGLLIFAGRRWRVIDVRSEQRAIMVEPASGGLLPHFEGGGGDIDGRIRQEMFKIYCEEDNPEFCDPKAVGLLNEGRVGFRAKRMDTSSIVADEHGISILPWAGNRVLYTLEVALRLRGIMASTEGIAVHVEKSSEAEVRKALSDLAANGLPGVDDMASGIKNKAQEKYDIYLNEQLLSRTSAELLLDIPGAATAVMKLVGKSQ